MRHLTMLASLLAIAAFPLPAGAAEIAPIKRLLPPEGLEIPADVRERLETRLAATKKRMEALPDPDKAFEVGAREVFTRAHVADIEIFIKAVELALLHREFYTPKDFAKADWALDQAEERLASLEKLKWPWMRDTGLVVRGYRSSIDGSAQPYGLVIPKDHDFSKPCPLYVWLHGRGDKNTDLHFLHERATKVGQIAPSGAIVLHPFGRHCVGYKHAGEEDVISAINDVTFAYPIDKKRMVLIGFSMGGAGAWHIGAHHASRFIAVSPGAGFAETARYQRLMPDKYPPQYEQALWGQYDAPNYVRNLFNTETIAYSGENDKQIQAARVMEEAFRGEGRELTHLIGPGVEHKYEPKTLEELLKRLETIAAQRPESPPRKVHLQTRTLDYFRQHWVIVKRLQEHWQDTRVDAEIVGPLQLAISTKNVAELTLDPWSNMTGTLVKIDGDEVILGQNADDVGGRTTLVRVDGHWKAGSKKYERFQKDIVRHGPIDDAFTEKFTVVTPSGKSRHPRFQAWVEFELEHLRARWRALMRAELPEMRDVEFKELEIDARARAGNLILFGDAESNSAIRAWQEKHGSLLPLRSIDGSWEFGNFRWDGDQFVPAMIVPAPDLLGHYLVFNSGLTFREGHDRTNSLQNPKLPDWAIIDIREPPDAFAPGRIHDAGFFDEEWKLKGAVKGPEAAP